MGFVQEPYGAPCTRIREPATPSLSLHSSPSSVLGSLCSSPSNPSSPRNHAGPDSVRTEEPSGKDKDQNHSGVRGAGGVPGEASPAASPLSDPENSEELTEEDSSYHNNNKDLGAQTKQRMRYRRGDGEWSPWQQSHINTWRKGCAKTHKKRSKLKLTCCENETVRVSSRW